MPATLLATQALLCTLALAATAARAPAGAPATAQDTRWVMGTLLTVIVEAPRPAAADSALQAALQEAQRLDALLSNYQPQSPLSRLNAQAGAPAVVPAELFAYLTRAREASVRTDGTFDITVGPLVDLHRSQAPTAEALAHALARVGVQHLRLAPPDTAELTLKGMALDPGGDGKGAAVDAMVAVLRARGIDRAWIDFGRSSLYGLGAPAATSGWRVLLRGPRGETLGVVTLRDQSLSTSSALYRDESGGPPHGHIVDPRSGKLVTAQRGAAVISPSATDADVLSTALIVGGGAGLRWVERFAEAAAAIFEVEYGAGTPAGASRAPHGETRAGRTRWMQPAFARCFEELGPPQARQP